MTPEQQKFLQLLDAARLFLGDLGTGKLGEHSEEEIKLACVETMTDVEKAAIAVVGHFDMVLGPEVVRLPPVDMAKVAVESILAIVLDRCQELAALQQEKLPPSLN